MKTDLRAELKDLDLNLFLIRSDRMENRLKELESDLQSMSAVLAQAETALQEKTERRDALQGEIATLEEKITRAHQTVVAGMKELHRAQDAVRQTEEPRSRRRENRERLESENAEAARRAEELEQLFAENESGTEERTGLLADK